MICFVRLSFVVLMLLLVKMGEGRGKWVKYYILLILKCMFLFIF